MQTMNDITLYDLMAEDIDIYIRENKKFGYDLEIYDERGNMIVEEVSVHEAAIDSFAVVCRRFLSFYDSCKKRQECVA
jgi:hypothetical protein